MEEKTCPSHVGKAIFFFHQGHRGEGRGVMGVEIGESGK